MTRILLLAILLLLAPDSFAQLDPRPVPIRRAPLPAYVPDETPKPRPETPISRLDARPSWAPFEGATRCEQGGDGWVKCDNGYREVTAR